MKNILVTGGAGFIGGNFIHYLLGNRPDCHITCLDALTYAGNLETLKSVLEDSRLRFVHGDITDREAVYHLFEEENFDAVVNFAAESHVIVRFDITGGLFENKHFGHTGASRCLQSVWNRPLPPGIYG